MSPAWLLFFIYYVATYVCAGAVAAYYVGISRLVSLTTFFAGAQVLRRIPGLPRDVVLNANYAIALGVYRLNYFVTLALSIAFWSSPLYLCVRAAESIGVPSLAATAVILAFVLRTIRHRAEEDRKAVKEFPGTGPKRAAVIGGGISGIVAAKELAAEGHEVVGFESASVLGGVWNADDDISKRTTGSTLSSSSRSNSFFGDYPMPSASSTSGFYPTHYTEGDFRDYLLDYARDFHVDKFFKMKANISRIHRRPGGAWEVWYEEMGSEKMELFDFVVVATGLNQAVAGMAVPPAKGNISHTAEYRGNSKYAGKKVVIVGLGESSSDTAADISREAEVHVVVRSPVLLLPRNTFGLPVAPDHKLSRLVLQCPQYVRTYKLLSQTILHGPFNWLCSNLLGLKDDFGVSLGPEKKYEDNWSYEWWKVFMKLGPLHPAGGWEITRGQVTKTAPVVESYRGGSLQFHTTDVDKADGSNVFLKDGTCIQNVDHIINATGYKTVWPFLEDKLQSHCSRDRYRMVFHPDLPDVAFVGFCRGGVGSIMQGIEMQSRWVALVLSGKRKLPCSTNMKAIIQNHRAQQIGKWATKVTMVYCNALAREEIGCEPDLLNVFLTSPKAWFYLIAGPYTNSMYRFRGPHATPKTAYNVYGTGAAIVYPLEYSPDYTDEAIRHTLHGFELLNQFGQDPIIA